VWLQDCIQSHEACKSSEIWSLPTRVVDVGSVLRGASPFLYVSKGECLPYTTLSYRWGSSMGYVATKENLAQLQQAIDLEMSATFRDAIFVTRQLRIKYLWIDALCIVQDDMEDWRRESGRMASIYGSSTLTLSATSSLSPSDGLAMKRPTTIAYEQADINGIMHSVHIRKSISHDFLHKGRNSFEQYPTLARGWCLQERLLSPRVSAPLHPSGNVLGLQI
jgi:hypothetical protein